MSEYKDLVKEFGEKGAEQMRHLLDVEKRLPSWAKSIVGRTKQRYLDELAAMSKRVKDYHYNQMLDFVSFSTKLINDMVEEVKAEASKHGYDYLVQWRKAQEQAGGSTSPKKPKN